MTMQDERFTFHAHAPRRPLRLPPRPAASRRIAEAVPDESYFDTAIELAVRAETDAEAMHTLGKHGTEADTWAMLMDTRGLHGLRLRVLADLEAVERAAIQAARPYPATDTDGRAEAAWCAARPMLAVLRRKYKAYASRNVGAWLARICGDRFDYTRRALLALEGA